MNTLEIPAKKLSPCEEAASQYEREGFCLAWSILPADLIKQTVTAMDAVMRRQYETGEAPLDSGSPGDPPTKLRKIDQPHVSDRTILKAISHPDLGRAIAAITGAKMLQVWCVQLLHKPPGGDTKGAVGWHQDYFYWKDWWTPESELFTAWLALSDVREESGPMHFAAGSHRWGLRDESNFWQEHDEKDIPVPEGEEWRDVSGAMPVGAFSLHHRLTFHGSRPNLSKSARYSFAIHLRTENSTPTPSLAPDSVNYDYVSHLHDPVKCPVIYRA